MQQKQRLADYLLFKMLSIGKYSVYLEPCKIATELKQNIFTNFTLMYCETYTNTIYVCMTHGKKYIPLIVASKSSMLLLLTEEFGRIALGKN